ncbi:MAG TPA: hypothetical protein VFK87_04385 [Steroidobacteraceae bacterium]|nr:hypothetical protein [Steroidobacteraceae bacterium]
MKHTLQLAVLAATVLVAGCQTDTPRADAAWGKSVANMIRVQTYDAHAAAQPAAAAPEAGDGQRLKNALDAHRKDVPKGQEQVSRTLQFEVGTAP